MRALSLLLLLGCTGAPAPITPGAPSGPAPVAPAQQTDQELFDDLLDNHYRSIFPPGVSRNSGGPQFFKYIYENLAMSHELFERYNRFYCGVSGSIIKPSRQVKSDLVRVKAEDGSCVHGHYHRCCWPCDCDVMKFARAEKVKVTLPKDPTQETRTYTLLTIGDPCVNCATMPCPNFPPEVGAYECRDGRTANGLRVKDGRLTQNEGRLVFAMLYDAPANGPQEEALVARCAPRTDADPVALDEMGGMGNIFVNLARINDPADYANDKTDLCQ